MSQFDVTVAGKINLDLILYGLAEQMPVERELLADDFRLTLGSSSAILAHNLSSLGTRVGFITRLGRDPLQVQPVDTIGAGDSYNAGFLKGYLERRTLPTCAAMGNVTAALSTLRPGGTEAYRDREFAQSFLSEHLPA